MTMPAWLPAKADVSYSSDKDWDLLVKRLYDIFVYDFIQEKCVFNGYCIIFDTRKIDSLYEEGFWHLISRDDNKIKQRLFDPDRACRLPWCNPTLENFADPAVCIWDYLEEDNRVKTYIWLIDFDYLIIIEKKNNRKFAYLITAYHVDGKSTSRSLREKYKKRI
jgi:hypothetical protein